MTELVPVLVDGIPAAWLRPDAPSGLTADDPIPANGDGENHPDVIGLRHSMSDAGNIHLARAGDFEGLAKRVGGDVTRLKAAFEYLVSRDPK